MHACDAIDRKRRRYCQISITGIANVGVMLATATRSRRDFVAMRARTCVLVCMRGCRESVGEGVCESVCESLREGVRVSG